jgi:hypothetical protein
MQQVVGTRLKKLYVCLRILYKFQITQVSLVTANSPVDVAAANPFRPFGRLIAWGGGAADMQPNTDERRRRRLVAQSLPTQQSTSIA